MGCGKFSISLMLGMQLSPGMHSLLRTYFLWSTSRSTYRTSDRISKRADQYTLQNLNWLITYLSSAVSSDVLTKVLAITVLKYSWPEVCMATIITMMSCSYDSPEVTLTYMKNIWLYSFTVDNILTYLHQLLLKKRGSIVMKRSSLITWGVFTGSCSNPKTHTSSPGQLRNIGKSLNFWSR